MEDPNETLFSSWREVLDHIESEGGLRAALDGGLDHLDLPYGRPDLCILLADLRDSRIAMRRKTSYFMKNLHAAALDEKTDEADEHRKAVEEGFGS